MITRHATPQEWADLIAQLYDAHRGAALGLLGGASHTRDGETLLPPVGFVPTPAPIRRLLLTAANAPSKNRA